MYLCWQASHLATIDPRTQEVKTAICPRAPKHSDGQAPVCALYRWVKVSCWLQWWQETCMAWCPVSACLGWGLVWCVYRLVPHPKRCFDWCLLSWWNPTWICKTLCRCCRRELCGLWTIMPIPPGSCGHWVLKTQRYRAYGLSCPICWH